MNIGETILAIHDLHVEFPISIGTVRAVQAWISS